MTDDERAELHDLTLAAMHNIARAYEGSDVVPNAAVLRLLGKLLDRTPEKALAVMEGFVQAQGVTLFARYDPERFPLPKPQREETVLRGSETSEELADAITREPRQPGAVDAAVAGSS